MTSLSVHDVCTLSESLDRDGYVVLRSVVSREPLTLLAEQLAEAYERSDKFRGGGTITGHLNCFPGRSTRFIYDDLVRYGIVEAIRDSVRPNAPNAVRATMNYNLPGSVAQHYHMDGLYTDDFLICNIAVVDTRIANGAIDVLPGTNREFLPFWKYAVRRTYRFSTRIEMEQGDVLIRKSTLWHRGMPNTTGSARPMMSITFGEECAPDSDPFSTFDGDIRFYPNWYSTSRLGVLRERTYVSVPVTYSAYRFVKSLHGNRGYDHF
jgi:ectoine hydroxylase-related dioxygenase (phytanoyl-CoA dioxygenase family)